MSDLVIASTTDTEDQIRAALGRGIDPPADETVLAEVDATTGEPIEEPAAAPKASEKAAKPAEQAEKPAEEAKPEVEAKPVEAKPPTRNEKRIAQLTAEKYTQMRRADQLQAQVEELTRRLEKPAVAAATAEPAAEPAKADVGSDVPEPTPDKFKTYEEYVKSLGEWSANKAVKVALDAERRRVQQEAAQTEAQTAQTRFDEARVGAAQRYADFEDTMKSDIAMALPLSDAMQYVIMNNPLGHDMAYHLVKHPEEAEAIAKLDGPNQVFAMGELAAVVKAQIAGTPKPKGEVAAKKPVSAAPAPIEPVGSHSTMSTVPDDQLSYREWADKRNKSEVDRRRRR